MAMDFSLSPAQQACQLEARAWLQANRPHWEPADELVPERWIEIRRAWQRRLHSQRYVGLTWPERYGGRGATASEQLIFNQEMIEAGAPEPMNVIGLGMCGPTIIGHGTDAQKSRHLDPILSGEEIWCQAFSEPNAGSDLSALSTHAEDRGDHYVVSGQKVWTSFAHIASWCLLLAREARHDNPRQGLTMLIVDMKTPGIEVRPLVQMTRDPEFNEVYFTDVRVPKSQVLLGPGEGWRVAMTTLLHERGHLGVTLAMRGAAAVRDLAGLARTVPGGVGPRIRQRIADLYVRSRTIQLRAFRVAAEIDRDGAPGPDASMVKLAWSELNQAVTETAVEILGMGGAVEDGSPWPQSFLRAQANTIEAGTSDVLRNVLAERVLGLPRSR
jgi:alkylation response protein AidB-like acyl-CoA dehydrogenase